MTFTIPQETLAGLGMTLLVILPLVIAFFAGDIAGYHRAHKWCCQGEIKCPQKETCDAARRD